MAQLFVLLMVVPAAADDATKAEAAALGDQGMAAMQRKDYQAAAALFEAADRRMHSPMFLVFRARALEKQDKLLHAERVLAAVLAEKPGAAGTTPAFLRAQELARKDRKSLLVAIPRLQLKGETAFVQIDGRSTRTLRRDTEQRVMLDPGLHVVSYAVSGASKRHSLRLERGDRKVLQLEVPVAAGKPAPPSRKSPSKPQAPSGSPPPSGTNGTKPTAKPDASISWFWPIGSFGLGAAGLVVGAVLGVQYLTGRDDFSTNRDQLYTNLYDRGCIDQGGTPDCSSVTLTQSEQDQIDQLSDQRAALQLRGILSPIALGLGVAGATVGTILTIQRFKSDAQKSRPEARQQRPARISWQPWVALDPRPEGPAVLGVCGRF